MFFWFYFSINLFVCSSVLLTPFILNLYGPHVAFGVPGLLMAMATLIIWMGRKVFINITAAGTGFLKETFSKTGLMANFRLLIIYIFVAMFWALFDQTGSAWVLQANRMDRHFLGYEWLPSQIQAVNPIMIMLMIPVFNGVKILRWPGLYALINHLFTLTPLRKISIGLFLSLIHI